GSTLTNENITTDYSEALIELVSPTFRTSWELLQYLLDLHQFVYQHLGDELLWATSMPSIIEGDANIPIAQYGKSNIGRMKTVYRNGLGVRYGRMMQAISGVHYNYSFPEKMWPAWAEIVKSRDSGQDFVSDNYFHLLRNYRRHGWIVLYLFGVSPVVCNSFLRGRSVTLPRLSKDTSYEPYATSLRMSDIGYRNRNQAGVSVSVNSLDEYLRDLKHAVTTRHPDYEKMGVKRDGQWLQLNTNVLQIENEYYSAIRPKRVARSGESPSSALRRGGVEYIEMRALDCSAFDPVGVNRNKLRFLEAFAALCLLKGSPPIGSTEQEAVDDNFLKVARRGREPGLHLARDGRQLPLATWAGEILDSMTGICELLDAGDEERPYTTALRLQQEKVSDVARTPSARLLTELQSDGVDFIELALRMSRAHKDYFLSLAAPNAGRLAEFEQEARESHAKQAAMEAASTGSFEAYLADWFARI
ncbi:MAG: glutamate--cysteine ligase, partial [Pseudomonadota bacterium]|nr:glutamate--cysteine ligase [Pseudomonadota bacterium]